MQKNSLIKNLFQVQSDVLLKVQTHFIIVILFLSFFIIFFIGSFSIAVKKTDFHNFSAYQMAKAKMFLNHKNGSKKMRFYSSSGEIKTFSVSEHSSIISLQSSKNKVIKISKYCFIFSLILSVISTFYIAKLIVNYKKAKKMENSFIRGGEIIDDEQLAKLIEDTNEKSDFQIGRVPIVKSLLNRHIGLFGDTGTGKSQQIFQLLDVLKKLNKKTIILDKSGEFVEHFYDEKKDIILAPFDNRSHGWTPFNEGTELFDFERLTKSFIPTISNKSGQSDHWPEASVTVFSWLLFKMRQVKKDLTIDNLIEKLLLSKNEVVIDELGNENIVKIRGVNELLKGTLAGLVIDPESPEHAASVMGSIIPKIRSLWYLRGIEEKPKFSFREWAKSENDSWVFIRVTEDQLDSVNPIVSAWLDTVIKTVLSLEKSDTREVWAIIDELQSLDKINTLGKGLFEGRKYGLRFILGFTSINQLYEIYGDHSVKAMMSMLGTKAVFRTTEPDGAEWNSKLLGEEEILAEKQHLNLGGKTNVSIGDQREKNALVSSTEIQDLDDLTMYLRFSGKWPRCKTTLEYKSRPSISPPFVERKIPEFISPELSKDQETINDFNQDDASTLMADEDNALI